MRCRGVASGLPKTRDEELDSMSFPTVGWTVGERAVYALTILDRIEDGTEVVYLVLAEVQ